MRHLGGYPLQGGGPPGCAIASASGSEFPRVVGQMRPDGLYVGVEMPDGLQVWCSQPVPRELTWG